MDPLDKTTPEDAQQALADTAIVDSQVPADNLVMQDAQNESELAQVEAQAAPGADRRSSVKAPASFEQQVAEEQTKLERITGKKPDYDEAQVALIERLDDERQQQLALEAEEQQAQQAEQVKESLRAKADISRYQAAKEKAASLGIPFKQNAEVEEYLAKQELEKQQLNADAKNQEAIAKQAAQLQLEQNEQDVDAQSLNAEQEIQKERLRPQIAANQVAQKVVAEQAAQREQTAAEVIAQVQKEREALAKQPFESYWSKKSTGEKILAAISMMLGGISGGMLGTGRNPASDIIMNAINTDVENQRLSRQDKFKAMDAKLEAVQQKIQQRSQMLKDNVQIAQAQKLQQEMAMAQEANNQARINEAIIAKGGEIPVSALSKDQQKAAEKLRSEYNAQSKDLGTTEIIGQYKQIQQFAKEPSAAGDIGLVFSYMKVLDPRSVVREGEFATAQNAGGISDKIRAQYNKALNGKRLSENQRQDFAKQAEKIVTSKLKTQRLINKRYSNLSQQYGVPSSLVIEKINMSDIAELSEREKLISRKMQQNKKLSRDQIESDVDRLIEKGLLDSTKYGR
jgi:hypothetical protein